MLRLAKMQLHGQGCERNLPMAQEWLRKARYVLLGKRSCRGSEEAASCLWHCLSYLHSCLQSSPIPVAHTFSFTCRYLGLHATLEELWAGEPEELEQMRAAVAARAARRAASKQGVWEVVDRSPNASE